MPLRDDDLEAIGEVLGEALKGVDERVTELAALMQQKADNPVMLSALEVLREQIKGFREHIDDLAKGMLHSDEVQQGFEGETLDAISGLRTDLAAKADHNVMTQAIDVVRGQFKELKDQLTALNVGLADVGTLQAGLEETLKAGETFAQNLLNIGDHIENVQQSLNKGLAEKLDRTESALALEVMGERIKDLRTNIDAVQQSLLDTGERQQMAEEETVRVFGEIFDSQKSMKAVSERIEERTKEYEASLAEKLDKETSIAAFDVMRGETSQAIEVVADRLKKIEDDILLSLDENLDALKARDERLAAIDAAIAKAIADFDEKLGTKVGEDQVSTSIHDLRADLVAMFDEATSSIDATVHDITEFAMADIKREFKEFSVKLREFHIEAEKWLDDMRVEVAEKLAEIKDGEQGPQGEPGKDGEQGPAGPAGKDGKDGEKGKDGVDALPWQHLGTHDPSKAYHYQDCVIKDGGTFQSKANNNTAVPGDSPLWQLIAARGQRGRPGEPGPQGLPGKGIEGPQGAQGEAALPFIEVRAMDDRFAFIREDGEVFECSALPLLAALRGDFRAFITEQIDLAVAKAVQLVIKDLEGSKKK